MNDSSELNFATSHIEFEPSTGYVGTSLDSMPEPITALVIDSYMKIDNKGRVIEGYWLRVLDDTLMTSVIQPVMHSFEFMQVSRLCAAIFSACGRLDSDNSRVGHGYTAYHNELARRLDPTLSEGPIRNLSCNVSGFANRGIDVRFTTSDATPTLIAAVQGCLSLQGMHMLARGFRDMADWRAQALDHASQVVIDKKAWAKSQRETMHQTETQKPEQAPVSASGMQR